MTLEDRLRNLADYDISFEIKQGYYHISVLFDESWVVLDSDNEFIYVEKRNGLYHYIASVDSVSIDEIFSVVDSTIEYNKDLEKKLELFKLRVAELQDIFTNESFEVLETLEFKYGKIEQETKKKKGKRGRPKKNAENIEEENNEMNVKPIVSDDNNNSDINEEVISQEEQYTIDYGDYEDYEDDEVVDMSNDAMEEIDRNNMSVIGG